MKTCRFVQVIALSPSLRCVVETEKAESVRECVRSAREIEKTVGGCVSEYRAPKIEVYDRWFAARYQARGHNDDNHRRRHHHRHLHGQRAPLDEGPA